MAEPGWRRFPYDPAVAEWAAHAAPVARRIVEATAPDDPFGWRCAGTWFVGVNMLPNDEEGRLPGGPPLAGAAIDAARAHAPFAWDRAQISVCLPGYPAHGSEETEAAFRYRLTRDAAHVDGLLRVMPGRRRKLKETHAFILGLPLEPASEGAAPLVVWEGSHLIMAEAFRAAFDGLPPEDWAEIDVTEIYQEARRSCFETCKRVEISAAPGEAYLVHRLALHGVAPWSGGEGRRPIAYFRPEIPPARWLPAWE